MATLAEGGRISEGVVDEEILRLRAAWSGGERPESSGALDGVVPTERIGELDPFDRVQLAEVVRVCRGAASLSEAGRALFAASRRNKRSSNDADRLRKYLARFGLTFDACTRR
jgi:transcriptional regulatory protein RtcR